MPNSWRTVRVFISSTFRDMHAERDHLVRFVFPRLRDELIKRRIHLVDVDLRWGVTGDQDAQEVCREIIDECRPRFLCILGGRYGWVPPGKEHSITADEVRYGVLDRLGDRGYAYFYFRDPAATAAMVEREPGEFREPPAGVSAGKLAALKKAITDAGLRPVIYPARWDGPQGRLAGLEEFGNRVYADLLASVDDQFGKEAPEPLDEFAEARAAMDAFIEERVEGYVVGSRGAVLEDLAKFAEYDGPPNILVLTGAPGCGKSALLAKFCRDFAAAHGEVLLVPHFIGTSVRSTDLRRTLRRLCYELNAVAGADEPIPEDATELMQEFPTFLTRAAVARRVVLVLDGLDQLDATYYAHDMHWLPHGLPSSMRVIVSSLEHPCLAALRRRGEAIREVHLASLTKEDARGVISGFLGRYHKRMTHEQVAALLAKADGGSPLYILVALEEVRTLGTYEEIMARIRDLPGEMLPLFAWILKRLEADLGFRDAAGDPIGPVLVRRFVSYLGVSRHGMAHQELAELIAPAVAQSSSSGCTAIADAQGNVAALERLLRAFLVHRGELLDFRHSRFRDIVDAAYLCNADNRLDAHRAVTSYFCAKTDPTGRLLWNGHSDHGFSELSYHQIMAEMWPELERTLCSPEFVEAKCALGMAYDLVGDYVAALAVWPSARDPQAVRSFAAMTLREARHFTERPELVFPQIHYRLASSPSLFVRQSLRRAQKVFESRDRGWLRALFHPGSGIISELSQHQDRVTRVACSSDGAAGFSVSADGMVKGFHVPLGQPLWETRAFRCVPTYIGCVAGQLLEVGRKRRVYHNNAVAYGLTVDRQGQRLFVQIREFYGSTMRDDIYYHILTYDALAGNERSHIFVSQFDCVGMLEPSLDGDRAICRTKNVWLATSAEGASYRPAEHGGDFRVWGTADGKEMESEGRWLSAMGDDLLAYDGRLALAWRNGRMVMSDVQRGCETGSWFLANRPIAVTLSPNREWWMAQLSESAFATHRISGSGNPLCFDAGHSPIHSWKVRSDNRSLVILAGGHLLTWDMEAGRLLGDAKIADDAQDLRLMAKGRLAAVTCERSGIVLFDLVSNRRLGSIGESRDGNGDVSVIVHEGLHDCVDSPLGGWAAVVAVRRLNPARLYEVDGPMLSREIQTWGEHRLELWDLEDMFLRDRHEASAGCCAEEIALSGDGRWLALRTPSCRKVSILYLYDLAQDSPTPRTVGKDGGIRSLNINGAASRLAWVSGDGRVTVLDLASGQIIMTRDFGVVLEGCRVLDADSLLIWWRGRQRRWRLSHSARPIRSLVDWVADWGRMVWAAVGQVLRPPRPSTSVSPRFDLPVGVEAHTVSGDGQVVVWVSRTGLVARCSLDTKDKAELFADVPLVRCWTDARGEHIVAQDGSKNVHVFCLSRPSHDGSSRCPGQGLDVVGSADMGTRGAPHLAG
jgi:hypothetical protein